MTVPASVGRLPGRSQSRGTHARLAEERVYVFFGDLGKRRVERKAHLAFAINLAIDRIKDTVHLGSRALDAQAHEAKAGALVEDDDQDHTVSDNRDMNVVALTFVREHREALLADQVRQPVGGGDVAGGEAGQAG